MTDTLDDDIPDSAAVRQSDRLAALPSIYQTKFERLAYELALRMEPVEDTFQRYGYTAEAAASLLESPEFRALCDRVGDDVQKNGLSFKAKAKAQAEELLAHSFDMATDPLVSSAVRADLIKWTARVAGLEPKGDKDNEKNAGGGLTLNISFAGQPAHPILSSGHEPVTIDQ